MTWRQRAHRIIDGLYRDGVVSESWPLEQQRKQLLSLYPWGERAMHPYKVWLDVVRNRLPVSKPQHSLLWYWRVKGRVVCVACQEADPIARGCMYCDRLRQDVREAMRDDRLRAMVTIPSMNETEQAIIADALADAGLERFAAIWRDDR